MRNEMESPPDGGPNDEQIHHKYEMEDKTGMTLKTLILDGSIVSSQMSLLSQELSIDFSELQDYFDWVSEQPEDQVVKKAAMLTKNQVSETNHVKWDQLSQKNRIYSLGECISEKMCTCFHRSVFYNLMMNKKNIDSLVIEGRVIETEKDKLHDNPKIAPLLASNALGLKEGKFFEDAHIWNIVYQKGKYYLVDTSFLINNQPVIKEIEFDNEKRNTFIVKLPDGKFRHYLSSGTVAVNT